MWSCRGTNWRVPELFVVRLLLKSSSKDPKELLTHLKLFQPGEEISQQAAVKQLQICFKRWGIIFYLEVHLPNW